MKRPPGPINKAQIEKLHPGAKKDGTQTPGKFRLQSSFGLRSKIKPNFICGLFSLILLKDRPRKWMWKTLGCEESKIVLVEWTMLRVFLPVLTNSSLVCLWLHNYFSIYILLSMKISGAAKVLYIRCFLYGFLYNFFSSTRFPPFNQKNGKKSFSKSYNDILCSSARGSFCISDLRYHASTLGSNFFKYCRIL